jgi:hypothetical protein
MVVSSYTSSVGIFTLTVSRHANGTKAASHTTPAPVLWTPVVGQDYVSQSSPLATFAGRIWYAIGNILFYSGNEEITQGVPEECFPSGLLGNFYRFAKPIVNLKATSEALYIICTSEVHWLKGSTKDSFQVQKIFDDVGGVPGYPRACTTADKSIIFLTSDSRLCIARGFNRDFLTDELGNDLLNQVFVADRIDIILQRFATEEKDLLLVACANGNDYTKSTMFVYDFNQSDKGLWNVPWGLSVSSMVAVQGIIDSSFVYKNGILMAQYTTSGAFNFTSSNVSYMDFSFSTMSDLGTSYACSYTVGLVRNPTGNHVNMLREPALVSVIEAVKMDRTSFTSDHDPSMTYYLDNSTGSSGTSASTPVIPMRRVQSVGYATLWFKINTACERISVKFSKTASTERFETQMLAFTWMPDSGS